MGECFLFSYEKLITDLNGYYKRYPKEDIIQGKYIHDCIYGTLKFNETQMSIIDLPCVQRLRGVSQTGLAKFVFPGAIHTRFEHSLGVCKIIKDMVKTLKNRKELEHYFDDTPLEEELCAAALLHDVGHVPFSHSNEVFLSQIDKISELKKDKKKPIRKNKPHEIMGYLLVKEENFMINPMLKKLGLDPDSVANHIVGHGNDFSVGFFSKLLSGIIDADRIDYLIRDAHFTGLPYGVIDVDRLVHTLDIVDTKKSEETEKALGPRETQLVVIEEKGYHAAEALLEAKTLLFPALYHHHVVRIAEILLQKTIGFALDKHAIDMVDLVTIGDFELLYKMENNADRVMSPDDAEFLKNKISDIRCRRMYKPISMIRHFNLEDKTQIYTNILGQTAQSFTSKEKVDQQLLKDKSELMREKFTEYMNKKIIAKDEDKIDKIDIIVDLLDFRYLKESNLQLKCKSFTGKKDYQVVPLTTYSQVSSQLQEKFSSHWRLSFYVSKDIKHLVKPQYIHDFLKEKYDLDLRTI